MGERSEHSGPVVTVLIPTFNRREYLPAALESAVDQTYRRCQIIVVNDGGRSVRDIVRAFNDSRILLLESNEQLGKAHALNRGIEYSEGKYVAYLDDDDVHYPHHVETLVDLLEGSTDCEAAYSDLYRTHHRTLYDGAREVLGKVLACSRDFDRWFLFRFNHIPHTSMMHRTDLLDKTGPYNESLRTLIGWDMARRMAFYSDFAHTEEITGERFSPVDECDLVGRKVRTDHADHMSDLRTIRATRPPKPWPKVKDLSIIFAPEKMEHKSGQVLPRLLNNTLAPYELILPLPLEQLAGLDTDMPNILPLPVGPPAGGRDRVDKAMKVCEGDYVALISDSVQIATGWVEAPMHALMNSARPLEAIRVGHEDGNIPSAVFRRHELAYARARFPDKTVAESAKAAGIAFRDCEPDEAPFAFDEVESRAASLENDGDFLKADGIYERTAREQGSGLWMKQRAAHALYIATGHDHRAMELCRQLNRARPTVDSLMLEAKLHRRVDRIDEAVTLLEKARKTLQRRG